MNKMVYIFIGFLTAVLLTGAGCGSSAQTKSSNENTSETFPASSSTTSTTATRGSLASSTVLVLNGKTTGLGGLITLDRLFGGALSNNSVVSGNSQSDVVRTSSPAAANKNVVSATTTTKYTFSANSRETSAANSLPRYVSYLNTYRSTGYYFQFSGCHGNPGSLYIKKGVSFMIDNRDTTPHTLVLGGAEYQLPALGYAVVLTPQSIGTYTITCDGGGAAKVIVED